MPSSRAARDPLPPELPRADAGAGVGGHDTVDALRRVPREPEGGQPAQRDAAHMRPRRARRIEDGQRIVSQPVQRVVARRRVGAAVSPGCRSE